MNIFFKSWDSILRVLITVIVAYPGLILLLRIYGKRSLSKLNMFDFIITVAFGSTLASVVIQENVTIIDGLVTFALLLTAQYIVTKTSLTSDLLNKIIKSDPTILFYEGEFVEKGMESGRVSEAEILASIRQQGIACLNDVHAVVLETNGELSVLKAQENILRPTLRTTQNYEKVT